MFELMKEFHMNDKFSVGFNNSFFCMIPKKLNPTNLGEYRPIILVNSLYIIVAKLIMHRLECVLNGLINETQSTCVYERQIMDVVLLTKEAINDLKIRKRNGVILKLDLEKAYDEVNWVFIDQVIQSMGFRAKFRRWIRECLSTTEASVLVNGSLTKEFKMERA